MHPRNRSQRAGEEKGEGKAINVASMPTRGSLFLSLYGPLTVPFCCPGGTKGDNKGTIKGHERNERSWKDQDMKGHPNPISPQALCERCSNKAVLDPQGPGCFISLPRFGLEF